jgi:uncharacterized protein (DUF1499 family)
MTQELQQPTAGRAMRETKRRKKRNPYIIPIVVVALLALFLFGYIDDWSRDFTRNNAGISPDAAEVALRPLASMLSTEDVVEAVRRAAGRIRTWEHIGQAEEGNITLVLFVRTSRIWRFKDDIIIIIEDLGSERMVSGKSASRIGFGDLGQNPRNLRRFLAEFRAVLEGAGPAAAPLETRRS